MDVVATLGLRVENSEAVRNLRQMDAELRRVAESSQNVGDTQRKLYNDIIRANGGFERYRQILQLLKQEEQQQIAREQELAISQQKLAESANNTHLTFGRLRGGVQSLVTSFTGMNPIVAQAAGVLGSFAIGTGVTVGILLGLAAIAKGYEVLTQGARDAKKAADDLTQSLLAEANAAYGATLAGKNAKATAALLTEDRASAVLRDTQSATHSLDPAIRLAAILRLKQAQKDYDEANRASAQAQADAWAEEASERKKADDEEAKRKKEEDAEAKRMHADALRQTKELAAARKKALDEEIKLRGEANARELKDVQDITAALIYRDEQRQQRNAALGFTTAGSNAVANIGKDGSLDNVVDYDLLKKLNGHFGDLSKSAAKAAQTISQAVEYYLVNKLGGGGFGSSLGASIAKGGFSDAVSSGVIGGFGATALGSAIFAPLVAGAGAAAGGLLDFVAGIGGAKEALHQMQEQAHQAALNARIDAQGFTTLQQALEQVEIAERKRLQEIEDAHFNADDTQAYRDQAYADAAQKRQRIEAEYAERARSASEDLEVRALRAQGRDKEANARDLANRQAAEIAAALTQGMSAEYIERLKQIQALERSKAALDDLTKSAVNAVAGYRYQATIFQNSPSRLPPGFPPPISLPYTPPPPGGYATASTYGDTLAGDLIVPVVIDGEKIAEITLKNFRKKAQRKFGTTERWSEI